MKTVELSDSRTRIPKSFPYKKARPLQASAIREISKAWEEDYRYVFLEAPTGFGKSAIAVSLARDNPKAFMLVSTKTLQEQYVSDKAFNAVQVKGRSNFGCMLNKRHDCNMAVCRAGVECRYQPKRTHEVPKDARILLQREKDSIWIRGRAMCSYWDQKFLGINHDYPVMNYSYFLSETSYAKDFSKRNLLICDEAHNIEDAIMSFIEFSMSDKDLGHINSRIPEKDLRVSGWVDQLKDWAGSLGEELDSTLDKRNEARTDKSIMAYTKKILDLGEKLEKCHFVSEQLAKEESNWVIDNGVYNLVRKVTFRPIFIKQWSGKIFDMADKFLLQSATIIDADAMADSLGLENQKCVFIRAPSTFKPEKRPIFFNPVGRMSKDNMGETLPRLVQRISNIMDKHRNEKGVIHTHTYNIQRYILENLKSDRFIANDDSINRDEKIREFVESEKPMILVTPSAYEGMDFKDDICRWQVICKIPYPDMGDSQVRKRMEADPKWYQWKSVLRLVQTYGRGTRSETDWCNTYLLDSSFTHLMIKNKELFPSWFTEALIIPKGI